MSEIVRALAEPDFDAALALYRTFGGERPPLSGAQGYAQFMRILEHPGTTILGAEVEGEVRAMATLHILPNMTVDGRPYALIENVVTLKMFERQGLGRVVMNEAIARAWAENAYKIMLLTGRSAGAKGFYEKLGFSGDDKHAMTLRKVPSRRSDS
ncbi:MAG: GNAT family N-acetyltransferase [Arenibacterium sp.]